MLGDNAAVSHGTAEKASELVNLNFVPCQDVGNISDGFSQTGGCRIFVKDYLQLRIKTHLSS